MDTSARSKSYFKKTKGRAGTTEKPDTETQRKEGRCFNCNKQGHLSRNCPDKDTANKKKAPIKGRAAETEASDTDTSDSEEESEVANTFIRKAEAMQLADKLSILKRARDAERGLAPEDEDF